MKYVIYQIRCKSTGKIYVGKHQTENVDDGYMGSGKLLVRAIKKYGLENFEKTILHVFDNEADMNSKEAELVTEEFCARKDTYNLCPGGKGGWGYVNQNGMNLDLNNGLPHEFMQDARKRGGKTRASQPRSESELSRFAAFAGTAFKGRKHSEESKEKMRRNHNPASHPRGPRGPYKKKSAPFV